MKKLIPQSLKNIYHLFQAILANIWFGFPSRKIKVIGVTGTDGKTTTVQIITKILEEADSPENPNSGLGARKVAMASTINFKLNEKEWTNLSHFTTLSAFAVQKFIRQAVDANCEYLVLETSSHSLDQHRVWGINYKTAVITNVTREHLDYHKTMKKYRQAKRKLFDKVETAIVNLDMEKPEEYLDCKAREIFGYSLKNENYKLQTTSCKLTPVIAEDIELGINYSKFKIQNLPAGRQGSKFTLNLVGDFNIENALAAISVGISEGISLETCAKAIEKIKGVPGRMEYVPNEKGLNILVDFALTPEALKKLYSLLAKIKKPEARIIAVFGACGERDRGKRPIIGEIVARYADFVIVTNDEPYRENPENIINEVFKGVVGNDKISNKKKEGVNCWRIMDRREAIRFALNIAQADDIIAVTGMGAEESMVVGDKKILWNDRKVILEELNAL
ncbi:MAG: UDP-N-acetylmuramyl-tripeptide synthetase [Candidatus Moranbacteria bacterium GW2011_GWE1_35_17]|nr:MAG: UDP-N-acetylmuramyl-tripeptide synthetase [Candidatus Moranbacteria bacterium GW2011_GWE1_35_17]KKP72757.1 MAG: UDP-N-acetylmuramyl-tripeptide synthetase [Candidatus Moranbacteria bacterium GW2011_GWE2_35_164]KKP81154.1 MAG: UDP-N-acetylmuramyl-tripeptide synthetase [Candidatus Moranbacteria bacterium GW2011_GWF1_35_5]KKP85189.1 MAG: UDP-N-acetylmuramyl-tripeptide synthetase [Candidatus Moranbacteria bacterium GW2011_GWF2_35_54]